LKLPVRSSAAWSAGVSTTHSWRGVARGSQAGGADLAFGEGVAARAVAHARHRPRPAPCEQPARGVAVVLQQVEGHALRRLHAHPGQAAQRRVSRLWVRVDQSVERGVQYSSTPGSERELHARRQPGHAGGQLAHLLVPTGPRRLRTASLKAAATRSSSMSLSSASRLGSMATRLTSCLQVIVTFTRPAPDWPSTSMVRQLVLRLLQVVLHGLGLLHQAGELSLVEHRSSFLKSMTNDEMTSPLRGFDDK
jgi:hypothetical protein